MSANKARGYSSTAGELREDFNSQSLKMLEKEREDLRTNVSQLKSQIEQLEEQGRLYDARVQSLSSQVEDYPQLQAENQSLRLEINELKETNSDLLSKLRKKDRLLKNLQAQFDDLKQEQEQDNTAQDKLYLAQAAYFFEQAICSHVLPNVFSEDNHATLLELLNYLNGGQKLPSRELEAKRDHIIPEAKRRWEKICKDMNLPDEWKEKQGEWNYTEGRFPDIIRAIGWLKRLRVSVAHPRPIRLKLAEEKVQSNSTLKFRRWQFLLIQNFICSLRQNISKSGIQHSGLKVD